MSQFKSAPTEMTTSLFASDTTLTVWLQDPAAQIGAIILVIAILAKLFDGLFH